MTAWHSTALSFASRHCPRALDFRLAGEPYDRTPYLVGVAAHAVLQALGEAAKANGSPLVPAEEQRVATEACAKLIAEGRIFEGEPEPPLPSELVWQGRDIALDYLRLAEPPGPNADYEIGLAVDRDWRPVSYRDPVAYIAAIIDVRADEFDEEIGGLVLVVRDWKTSWRAGVEDPYTLQRRMHALVAWAHAEQGKYAGLATEVVNLRNGRSYPEKIQVGDTEGELMLTRWRRDIDTEIRAREEQVGEDGARPVAPGAYCSGCPYLFRCPEGMAALTDLTSVDDPREVAVTLATLEAARAQLLPVVRRAAEVQPLTVDGGEVGYREQVSRVLSADAAGALWDTWTGRRKDLDEGTAGYARGLLMALGISASQIDSALKRLQRSKADRETWIEAHTEPVVKRRFGVWKAKTEGDDADTEGGENG